MTSWRRVQETLSAALCDETAAMVRMPSLVTATAARTQRSVDVYRTNTRGARARVYEQIYPVCRAILGERCFRTLVGAAIQTPSQRADLNHAGDLFPDVLRVACSLDDFAGMAYLPDLAQLEWLLHDAYFAADAPAVNGPQLLARLRDAPQDVHFMLTPPVRLHRSPYGVGTLWREHAVGQAPTRVAERSEYLVVHRREWWPGVSIVDAAHWRVLDAIHCGVTFRDLADFPQVVPALVTAMGAGWVTAGDGAGS